MSSDDNALTEKHLAYAVLTGTFLTVFGVFNFFTRRTKDKDLKPFDLLLLGLSSYRMSRMASYDLVLEPYRAPFTETGIDPTGAGDTVRAAGTGWRRAIGELIACPICIGTWISAALVYGLEIAPRPTRLLLKIMGAIGLAELFNALTEFLSWSGQAAREEAGTQAMRKAQSS